VATFRDLPISTQRASHFCVSITNVYFPVWLPPQAVQVYSLGLAGQGKLLSPVNNIPSRLAIVFFRLIVASSSCMLIGNIQSNVMQTGNTSILIQKIKLGHSNVVAVAFFYIKKRRREIEVLTHQGII